MREAAETVRKRYVVLRPDWLTEDSPLKYVDWAREETISKSAALAAALQPAAGARVFEIGPGTGYLLFVLRELYGCRIAGCDVQERPLYREMHQLLGITTVTDRPICRGQHTRVFRGLYDLIIGTQISWMDDWRRADLDLFLEECFLYLEQHGRVVLFPNPKALGGVGLAEAFGRYRPQYLQLPYLGQGVILRRAPRFAKPSHSQRREAA